MPMVMASGAVRFLAVLANGVADRHRFGQIRRFIRNIDDEFESSSRVATGPGWHSERFDKRAGQSPLSL
jgi:hypothetical protein